MAGTCVALMATIAKLVDFQILNMPKLWYVYYIYSTGNEYFDVFYQFLCTILHSYTSSTCAGTPKNRVALMATLPVLDYHNYGNP